MLVPRKISSTPEGNTSGETMTGSSDNGDESSSAGSGRCVSAGTNPCRTRELSDSALSESAYMSDYNIFRIYFYTCIFIFILIDQ